MTQSSAPSTSMTRGRRTVQTVLLLGLIGGAIVLAARLSVVFTPLLVAFLLTYLLNPLVNRLERWMPRLAAILVTFLVVGAALAAFLVVGIPKLVHQGATLVEEGFIGDRISKDVDGDGELDPEDEYEDRNGNGRYDPPKFRRFMTWSEAALHQWLGEGDWKQLLKRLREETRKRDPDILGALQGTGRTLLQVAMGGLQTALGILSFVFLVPVYLFFLLRNMTAWGRRIPDFIPDPYRERTVRALNRIHAANAAFFRGQITVAVISGTIISIALTVLGVKLSFLFGALYTVLSMIPYLGTVTVFGLTALFTIADSGGVSGQFYGVVGLFLGIQVLEAAVLQPLILGRETGLHPMVVILAILTFGSLFGFFGILLAVPMASATVILGEEFLLPLLHRGSIGETALRPAIKI